MCNTSNTAAITQGTVTANQAVSESVFYLKIKTQWLASHIGPGQFLKLRAWPEPGEGGAPLLDRPFSLHRVESEDEISVLYRVLGQGTKALSRLTLGSPIKVSGPFGQGLAEAWGANKPDNIYLAAGGMGLAPMAAVADWLGPKATYTLFYGERTGAAQVDKTWLRGWAKNIRAATEDGTGYGDKGLITAALREALEDEAQPIFTCGPPRMLEAVVELGKEFGVPVWVSTEARMACGNGVCLTCSLPLLAGGRFRVCQEGPVFDGRLIDWKGVA